MIISFLCAMQHTGACQTNRRAGYSGLMNTPRRYCLALLIAAAPAAFGQVLDMDLAKEQARATVEKMDASKPLPESTRPMSASPQMDAWKRFEKGIERAGELAPPRPGEAPKIEEIIDPGGYGRRRYRVISATGTYCITYESNHAPDGLDTMANGIKPKITTCPKDEQPATRQPD